MRCWTNWTARLIDPAHCDRSRVLYIDLDRFKVVNDVLGHAAGDAAAGAAPRAASSARSATEGLIARFGGDEFLVVCDTGDDPGAPERLADAILEAFADSFRIGRRGVHASPPASASPARRSDGAAPAAADPERRRGDVRQQAPRPQQLAGVHAGAGRAAAAPPADGDAAAARGRQRRIPAWSTSRRSTCATAASSRPKR